jgi:hypothetical protein
MRRLINQPRGKTEHGEQRSQEARQGDPNRNPVTRTESVRKDGVRRAILRFSGRISRVWRGSCGVCWRGVSWRAGFIM